jgi:hypothetical protein
MRAACAQDLDTYRSLLEDAGLPEASLADQFGDGFVLAVESRCTSRTAFSGRWSSFPIDEARG